MSTDLTLYELTGSPNNVKARIALGYKQLTYDRVPVPLGDSFPGDRSSVVARSRQPRLPVLQDGKTVIFDSAAILRYLDANYPDTPPLFADDYREFGEIEQWELYAKTQLSEPIGLMFEQAFSPKPDPTVIARAGELLNDRTGKIEDRLTTNEFLVGSRLTAADIVCASPLYVADMTEANARRSPIAAFFHGNMTLGDGREKTRAWLRRIMAYDSVLGQR